MRRKINTGSKTIDALYTAVQKYCEDAGGKILVLGGVEIQRWPEDKAGQFRVAIKCLGKPPKFDAHA